MNSPLRYLSSLLFSLSLTASAQTFVEGDYQINRKKATAGFEVAELLAGSNITFTWNNTNKTVTLASPLASTGGTSITTLGTITTGTWQATALADTYIASAATWNAKQAAGNYLTALTGDVTATGPGSVAATIANQVVTFAKMQHISTAHLLGRHASGSGDVQQIGIDGGLELQGSNMRRAALTGDVTASAGSNTTTIANDAVTYAKMQNVSSASRLLGRGPVGAGDVQELTLGTGLAFDGTSLVVNGYNPFDQGLNTTDAPQFDSTTLDSGNIASGTNNLQFTHVGPEGDVPYISVKLNNGTDDIGQTLIGFRGDGLGSGTSFVQGATASFRIEQDGGTLATVEAANISGTNTGDVTLAGTPNYLTLTDQVLTRSLINLTTHVTGTLPVANGGTGASTLTANNVLLGNGTSALQTVAPGTNGNVLTSNGTTWTSASGFNGTVGAVTPAAGTFTILNANTFGAALEREMVRPATWQIPWRSDLGTSTTAGSGSVNASNWSVNCQTGTTTSSRAQRALILAGVSDTFTAGPAVDSRVIDWSKRVTVGFAFNLVSASTNGQVFVRIGNSCSTSGNLSGSGMGIRINNTALVAQCHNGTTLNTSASLKTNTAGTTTSTVIVLQSDGAGNVAVYVDNVLAVTMTGGPTTAGFATDFLAVEAINNTDASSTRVHVSPIKYYTTY